MQRCVEEQVGVHDEMRKRKALECGNTFDPNITPTDISAAYVGDMLQTVHSKN